MRLFVWQEQAYGPERNLTVPEPVQVVLEHIDSPFLSVDIVKNQKGTWRMID